MKFVASFLLLVVFASTQVESKSYRNHKVVSLTIENETQLQEIRKLEMLSGFTFIDPPVQVNMKLDLVISPEMFSNFEEMAGDNDISFEVSTGDLQSWIDQEKPKKARKDGFAHEKFNTLDEIYDHLTELAQNNFFTTIFNIGTSYEGRQLKVIRYTKNLNNPAIFIEANIHAREWISSATAVWIADTVINSVDPAIREAVDSLTWYILPIMNPDGFVYSHDEVDGDRLWRKTRSIHNIFCHGVDANRNFGYNFMQGGSSPVACTDTYAGPAAFSEKEAKAVMDFYATIADKAALYLSFHCAAEMLLYPMGHTITPVDNKQDLDDIAKIAVDALFARNSRQYRYGNVMETLYIASGSSPDHAYGVYGTKLAYTYEFRAGVGTPSRFILPPEEIVPNSQEVFDSILAMVQAGKERGYFTTTAA